MKHVAKAPTSDERDRLVKTFAYEYVMFNHDPNHCYLVTDVTDDCMLEIEGMPGLFAPTCFSLAPQPKSETTAGADGRYCTHHDDDPAHGTACYLTPARSKCDEWLDTLTDSQLDNHSQSSLANEAWKRGAAHAAQEILNHLEPIDTVKIASKGSTVEATAIGAARVSADKFIDAIQVKD